MQVNSKKNKAFQYLDANASVLNRAQLIQGLVDGCGLTVKTATSYVSAWRKSNGVQRKYVRSPKGELQAQNPTDPSARSPKAEETA